VPNLASRATSISDAGDLAALVPLASAVDLETVRELLRLIEARSYNRGRDLCAELEHLTSG
jgi:hypothetical protein